MHKSVLLQETIRNLSVRPDGIYIDATFGGGETSQTILQNLDKKGKLIVLDLDPQAIEKAKKLTSRFSQLTPVHANFKDLDRVLADLGIEKVNGIIADLGISNIQLLEKNLGFSIDDNALLDMRMNPQGLDQPAYQVLRRYTEKDLVKLFCEIGEQPFCKRIARAVKIAKNIETVNDFYQVIQNAIPPKMQYQSKKIAINLFRALRMETNHEIENLTEFIPKAIQVLKPSGRLAIISFHSIEDRIVKHLFRKYKQEGQIEILTPKPVIPTEDEIQANPKSRSAKLRACEKAVISD